MLSYARQYVNQKVYNRELGGDDLFSHRIYILVWDINNEQVNYKIKGNK